MGFDWTAITQNVTIILAAHQNEIRTNINTVYDDLELDHYAWVYLPVDIGEEIDDADFQEMRDAIDFADEQNTCRNHDVAYDLDDNAIAETGDDGIVHTGADSNYNPGYDGTNNPGVDTDYDSSVDGTNRVGVDTGHDSTVYSGEDSGVDNGHEASAVGTYDTGDEFGYCTDHQAGDTG